MTNGLRSCFGFGLAILCVSGIVASSESIAWGADSPISLESLLDEMIDFDALCELPSPEFVCKQASSFDRAAVAADQPNWFANADASQFIRTEENNGRQEWVLFDSQGPGAIVRFWITAPHYKNKFYFYFDGETEPSVQGKIDDLIGGDFFCDAPLSSPRARGRDLYFPIPYAKSLKITCDQMDVQGNLYYQINYRTYSPETDVQSYSTSGCDSLREKIAAVNQILATTPEEGDFNKLDCLGSSGAFIEIDEPNQAIQAIEFKLDAEDQAAALRNTVVKIEFDGEETVWCPVGEFFGSGIGVNPNQTRFTQTMENGTMLSFWTMPFRENAKISFEALDGSKPNLYFAVYFSEYEPTERTMYFHCDWRQERRIQTVAGNGTKDWNYITIDGQGVYVGDVLCVLNRDPAWWGEGDEKIYVDGETFPSHFGTGTEDYYGYAWCTPEFFEAPFHAQPRAEGPSNFGNTTNLRFRSLDKIPFEKSFRFDMEVWHWAKTEIDYAVATFWYGTPGTKAVGVPSLESRIEEASQKVSYRTKYEINIPGFKVANAPNGRLQIQDMKTFQRDENQWDDGRQLWWTEGKPGDSLVLTVAVEKENPKTLTLGLTAAKDYGNVEFYLDGEKIGGEVSLFHPDSVDRNVFKIEGLPDLAVGDHQFEVRIVGKDERSSGYLFGIDSYKFQ